MAWVGGWRKPGGSSASMDDGSVFLLNPVKRQRHLKGSHYTCSAAHDVPGTQVHRVARSWSLYRARRKGSCLAMVEGH